MSELRPLFVVAVAVLLSVAACSGDGPLQASESEPVSVIVVSGNGQTALQGDVLSEEVVVRVLGSGGVPISEAGVRTRILEGGGSVDTAERTTDSSGETAFTWTVGDEYTQRLEVYARDNPDVTVTARASALYRYVTPEQVEDGWGIGQPPPEAMQILSSGVDEIRKGSYPELHSLLVASEGRLVLETYFPGHDSQGNFVRFDRDTPHEVQSASKSFRSAMIGIAIDQGFINGAQATVAELLPDHVDLLTDEKMGITLEHLLTMSSGLAWNEWSFPFGDSRNTLSTMYSLPYPQWAEYVLSRPVEFEPGSRFVYNTGASIMLNEIVIEASATSLAVFVRDHYTSKVQSSRLPGLGNPLGAHTIPRDMAKLGQIYLNDGLWDATRVLSAAWIEKSLTPRFRVDADDEYGYQWWIRTLTTASASYLTQYASGNGGQFIFVVEDLDLVVVSTGGNFGSSTMFQAYDLLERYVLPAFE